MNNSTLRAPNYIFEVSWEVCNKVGGIYTVLSSKALVEHKSFSKSIYIGPDIWKEQPANDFIPMVDSEYSLWAEYARNNECVDVRVGKWDVPGAPIVILVDYLPFMSQRNAIYGDVWEWFGVESLHAYGDYHDASMFGYAAGKVIESFYRFFKLNTHPVVAQFHEWMTSFGLFYCRHFVPEIATIFTTHATSIGRSIAGNGKPLYAELNHYNGDQMAQELNMEAKHSAEKKAAHFAHCFTTVSDITAKECEQLLEKSVDIVTHNGFEDDFVPKGSTKTSKKRVARKRFISVAESLLQREIANDVLIVATSGRYEYKNKGIDLYIESMHALQQCAVDREVLAFILVPAWNSGPRTDLREGKITSDNRITTHQLMEPQHDPILNKMASLGMNNALKDKVNIIFVPSYLDGNDGIFNLPYYDLLIGCDLTIFPSYYEPWGYTPMESAAFGVPTITTDLAGFGLWVSDMPQSIEKGVAVLHRTDYMEAELIVELRDNLLIYLNASKEQRKQIATRVSRIAKHALWEEFYQYYKEAYDIALGNVRNGDCK